MSEWINVEYELPNIDHPVLGLVNTQEHYLDHHVINYSGLKEDGKPCWESCILIDHPYFDFRTKESVDPSIDSDLVKYWMPLPSPPEVKK